MKTWPVNRRTTDNFYSWSEKLTGTFSLLGELKITCFYYILGTRYFFTISSMCSNKHYASKFLSPKFSVNIIHLQHFMHCTWYLKNFSQYNNAYISLFQNIFKEEQRGFQVVTFKLNRRQIKRLVFVQFLKWQCALLLLDIKRMKH